MRWIRCSLEETGAPGLARYESRTSDTEEEANNVESVCVRDSTGKTGGDGSGDEEADHDESRAESIAQRTTGESTEEPSDKGDDVAVQYLFTGKTEIGPDGPCEQRRKGILQKRKQPPRSTTRMNASLCTTAYPCHEGEHEGNPREEEHSSMSVDWVDYEDI